MRAVDQKRDRLVAKVATGRRALTDAQQGEARWIVGAIPTVNAFKDGGVRYPVPGLSVQMAARRVECSALTHGAAGAALPVAVAVEQGADLSEKNPNQFTTSRQ